MIRFKKFTRIITKVETRNVRNPECLKLFIIIVVPMKTTKQAIEIGYNITV